MNGETSIVVVEDDREIGALVQSLLEREGYGVRLARSGAEMDAALAQKSADLLLLDVMLPGEDGFSICRRLRAAGNVPIMMLTARGDDIDRIVGLELGADDYLAKPFNPRELVARIRAVLRRTAPAAAADMAPSTTRLRFDRLVLDMDSRRLFNGAREIELSTGDFDLLSILVRNPQRVLSRDQLMDMTKGRSWEAFDRSIDVALSRLRRKIESDPTHPVIIKTIRSAGYMFTAAVTKA
jgi:two-component system OmpR family response regulator